MLTTFLDVLGVLLLAACAWFVWPPLPLAVLGLAALVSSRQMVRGDVG